MVTVIVLHSIAVVVIGPCGVAVAVGVLHGVAVMAVVPCSVVVVVGVVVPRGVAVTFDAWSRWVLSHCVVSQSQLLCHVVS